MTGDINQFFTLKSKEERFVTFGDNKKEKIIGIGNIKITPSTFIENILLVDKLKHNLLSISQLCDVSFDVNFKPSMCIVADPLNSNSKFIGQRLDNVYIVDLDDLALSSSTSLVAIDKKSKVSSLLWHRRLGHASMHTLAKLISKDLVNGMPKLNINFDHVCGICQQGKQTRGSFKSMNVVSTTRTLELLHMDLLGPTRTTSLGGKKYALVIVDDFSRYTWILFLAIKDETFKTFKRHYKRIINLKGQSIISIRSDHGSEFENQFFDHFCSKHGIDCYTLKCCSFECKI